MVIIFLTGWKRFNDIFFSFLFSFHVRRFKTLQNSRTEHSPLKHHFKYALIYLLRKQSWRKQFPIFLSSEFWTNIGKMCKQNWGKLLRFFHIPWNDKWSFKMVCLLISSAYVKCYSFVDFSPRVCNNVHFNKFQTLKYIRALNNKLIG